MEQPTLVPYLDESTGSLLSPQEISDNDQARYVGASTHTSPEKESRIECPKVPTTSSRTNRTLDFISNENRETIIPVYIGRGPRPYGRPSLPPPLTQVPRFELSTAGKRTILLESCRVTAFNLVNR